MKQCWRAANA